MSIYLNLVIVILELCLASAFVILLHRLHNRLGLMYPIFGLGALVAALQLRSLGMYTLNIGAVPLQLSLGSYVLLPPILLGLLIIYVVNGSTRARNTLIGLVSVTFLIALLLTIPSFYQPSPGLITFPTASTNPPARIPIASALTIPIDMIVLVIVYQSLSNWRGHFPSLMASGAALMAALWSDALVFPLLAYLGTPSWPGQLAPNLIGKSIAGAILWPIAMLYLSRAAHIFPNSAATTARPVLDLFTTRLQLEARAQFHYSLLRTISQINGLIVQANNPQALLDQVCKLLAQGRDYSLIWIGMAEVQGKPLRLRAKAGPRLNKISAILPNEDQIPPDAPSNAVLRNHQAVIITASFLDPQHRDWQRRLSEAGFPAYAAFPIRHQERCLGVLNVYSILSKAFSNPEETNLLQELADNLAHALVSLEARRQQAFLSSAAETMRDGMLITDVRGRIIYANPTLAEMFGFSQQEMVGRRVFRFMTPQQSRQVLNELAPQLWRDGQYLIELEMPRPTGKSFISFKASLVRNLQGEPATIVVSLRDTTHGHKYENRLITLNRLTTELVQIHDPHEIYQAILGASEELLDADASAIFLMDSQGAQVMDLFTHKMDEECAIQIQAQLAETPPGIRALLSNPIYVNDVEGFSTAEEGISALTCREMRALMTQPVFHNSQPAGVLALYYRHPQQFSYATKQMLATVVNNLTIALQNAHLYQAEHSQRQLAEALAEASAGLNSSLNLDEVLDQILEQTLQVVPCRSVNLMLIEGEHAYIVRQLPRSEPDQSESLTSKSSLPLSTPNLNHMLLTGLSILISNTKSSDLWQSFPESLWVQSYAGVPLIIYGKVIGFLNVYSDQPDYFDRTTTRQMQAFAANAAAAMHNANLYSDLQKYTAALEDRVRERTAEVSAAKERIEVILASVPEAVFVLDEAGHLLEVNHSGESLYQQAEEERQNLFEPEFLKRLKSGQMPDEKAVLEVKGRAYQALASTLPLEGGQTGWVIVYRDITRFRELDQMKTRFVSDVSHELRTPLTNLSLYLDLLASERAEESRRRYLETLRRETDRLTHLIEGLLTISRLESNRVAFEIQAVNIETMTRTLVDDRAPMAAQRELSLRYEPAADLPNALADPRLITQVLSNLLTNAFNYTPAQGAILLTTNLKQLENENWVTISISDTGAGIQPEELPHVFERFFRGSASRKSGAPGTGLGLAICKEIMERMGGHITVQSLPEKGSTFTVWLQAVL
ncbi:MAG: GAF domain-containing protein [Anaerolineales bacterium]|nr:GAF domain-containing protein [Anaerolineales bacterium]